MNKILYSPQEGTTGFWGLRGVRMKPRECPGRGFCSCDGPPAKRCEVLAWEEEVESCKSNKLEIVNIDEQFTLLGCADGSGRIVICGGTKEKPIDIEIKPGDIFDLPIGYEFLELESLPIKLRLVKTETPALDKVFESIPKGKFDQHYKGDVVQPSGVTNLIISTVPQPEPEESQNEKEWERFWYKFGENDFDMRNAHKYYTIQRKKQ